MAEDFNPLLDDQRLVEQRRKKAAAAAKANPINPQFGQNVWDPNSYIETLPADPALAEPLPTGRYADPRIPSQAALLRAQQVQEFRKDPKGYIERNTQYLNAEQSLIDKGKSMMQRIFDYRDAPDLSIFGVNLGLVESVWDKFTRAFTGFTDTTSLGLAYLAAQAPGGLDPMTYNQLSGDKSPLDVLSGEMDPGSAPSAGQIITAGLVSDAQKLKDGKATAKDLLFTSPLTLGALFADEKSLLAQPDFDITNKKQREAAFGQGWERWSSGAIDFGSAFADPLIAGAAGGKILRAGMLGARSSAKLAKEIGVASDEAIDLITTHLGDARKPIELYDEIATRAAGKTQPGQRVIDQIKATGEVSPTDALNFQVWDDMGTPDFSQSVLAPMYWRWSQFSRETGKKIMSAEEIARQPEIRALTDRGTVAALIHDARNPLEVATLMEALHGTPGAMNRLSTMRAAMANDVLELTQARNALYRFTGEPQKIAEASGMLERKMATLNEQVDALKKRMDDISPSGSVANLSPQQAKLYADLGQRRAVLGQSLREADEMHDMVRNGRNIDILNQNSAFYNPDMATRVIEDLHSRQDFLTRALNSEIQQAAIGTTMPVPYRVNPYSKMVTASRARRGTAAFQYAAEGSGILPKRIITGSVDGVPTYSSSGWFSPSQFDGVTRMRRAARVWRWMGSVSPSGYVGLRGTANVGSESEIDAVLDLDIYKNPAVAVSREVKTPVLDGAGNPMFDATGKALSTSERVEEMVGGLERRQQLVGDFMRDLRDPTKDSLTALKTLEDGIADDMASIYGLDADKMQGVMATADRRRKETLDRITKDGMFVDNDGTMHYVPYLETHLANGTYMHNWQAMQQILDDAARKDGIAVLNRRLKPVGGFLKQGDETFQNFWRPVTLLRLSYTQRNVVEGLARAMAFTVSLAPLKWPVQATVNGVRNAVVRRVVDSRVKKAAAAIADSDYNAVLQELDSATFERSRLMAARQSMDAAGAPVMVVSARDANNVAVTRQMSVPDYEAALRVADQRAVDAESALVANADMFTEAVKGTKFGEWRQKQLTALGERLLEQQHGLDAIAQAEQQAIAAGHAFRIEDDPALLSKVATLSELIVETQRSMNVLMYHPQRALGEYQGIAGRARRIGSGTSVGPDGGYYNDAFAGPLTQINRNLLSADNTVKQQLSVQADVFNSLFARVLTKENVAVPWEPGREDDWINGMVSLIEDASSSRVVQKLVENNWDAEAVVSWMLSSDKEAQVFTQRILHLFGTDPMPSNKLPKFASDQQRLVPFESVQRSVSGTKYTAFDEDAVRQYVLDAGNILRTQLQNQRGFFDLLERRLGQKRAGFGRTVGEAASGPVGITAKDVKAVIDSLSPEQRNNLSYVVGSEHIQLGTNKFGELWSNWTNQVFRFLGTIPEDAVTRGPFYNERFKDVRNELIEQYWAGKGTSAAEVRRMRGSAGQDVGGSIEHDEFRIPANEMSRMEQLAHRRALSDTREFLYTIERRTNLGKYGEWVWPFVSAQQNTVTTIGKLLWREPWLAPMIIDLWRAPQRAGWEDEEGNLHLPMPLPWVRDFLAEHPEVPFLGGTLDSTDELVFPKNGLNLWLPESGFGLAPTPTVWVQMSASELMKRNVFPVETPQIIKTVMGEQAGNQFYENIKRYMFGEEGQPSTSILSVDMAMPAYAKKMWASKDTLSQAYGYEFTLQQHTQQMRFLAHDRPEAPTNDEIHQRTTNALWMQALGNIGVPTPLTPYPILTRPIKKSATELLIQQNQIYTEKDPLNASLNISKQFGDWALPASLTRISENVGGGQPFAEVVSDAKTLSPLIGDLAPQLGQDNLDVLGILVNNRTPRDAVFSPEAYSWQRATKISGSNRAWRETQSPEMAEAERQRIAGHTMYRQFRDQLDARLFSAGLPSYEVAKAAPYKAALDRFTQSMKENPEYAGWRVDFEDIGGNRTGAAIRVLQAATADPTFIRMMTENNKTRTLSCMAEYLYYRRAVINAANSTGKSVGAQSNAVIKLAWAAIRQRLRNSDDRWAEIQDLYLSGDEEPVDTGTAPGADVPLPQELIGGELVGLPTQ